MLFRSGIGDEQVWYRVLKPAERQQLRDRKELRLSANNIRLLNAEAKSVLRVDLKNISELMVRVYELNTESFYRTHEEDLDTDLDLDGLVATSERSLKFSQPAIIRHREEIDLSSITGRGVWIVDLVGDGLRARALLRKGSIDHVDGFNADGMSFTVIDENRQAIRENMLIHKDKRIYYITSGSVSGKIASGASTSTNICAK